MTFSPTLGDREGHVQVAPDSTGKIIRNVYVMDELSDGTPVLKYMQTVVVADAQGRDLVDFGALTSALEEIRDLLREIKEIAERNWT